MLHRNMKHLIAAPARRSGTFGSVVVLRGAPVGSTIRRTGSCRPLLGAGSRVSIRRPRFLSSRDRSTDRGARADSRGPCRKPWTSPRSDAGRCRRWGLLRRAHIKPDPTL